MLLHPLAKPRLKTINPNAYKYIQIDQDGFPSMGGLRVQDVEFGKKVLLGIQKIPERNIFRTEVDGEKYILEAFDQPLVAQLIHKTENNIWVAEFPYGIKYPLNLNHLFIDEWDRFHSRTAEDIPIVFSRKAQADFFNLVDSFEDDHIVVQGVAYPTKLFLTENQTVQSSQFWTVKYLDTLTKPGWDLDTPHPILKDIIPQLKIPKSRILVVGCGRGHDAAELAQRGHVVTGVDFSEAAITDAKKLYGNIAGLKFIKSDVFQLSDKFFNSYDIVFEHTLFCAIDPARRNDLIKVYKNCLIEGGYLLGIFFILDKYESPPFGGTEWEYRERLKKNFHFLYWTRWKGPSPRSAGSELVVYAKKT